MTDSIHVAGEIKSYPASTDSTSALDRSKTDMLNAAAHNRRAHGILWNGADKCPLFIQKRKHRYDEHGNKLPLPVHAKSKKVMAWRANRALSSHTLRIMASGSAATVGAQLAEECGMLRTRDPSKGPEHPKYPLLPTLTLGAAYAIEAAYIAYMQELFHTALSMKTVVNKHKKVTAKGCQLAADVVNAKIAAATSFVPPSIAMRKVAKTIRKASSSKTAKGAAAAAAAAAKKKKKSKGGKE
tara:strand:+ start:116 stop:838 length:723 start_codon:yes stop_codon:yes gene_type:complete